MEDPNRRENHSYLSRRVLEALGRSASRRKIFAVWLVLIAAFIAGAWAGLFEPLTRSPPSPTALPVAAAGLVVVVVAGILVAARLRLAGIRAGHLRALQAPGPGPLVEQIERTLKSSAAIPDADAFTAQSKALAFALYGDGAGAARALETVRWGEKAPLVQAVGLSAEGLVALLCHRDAARSLELTRKARALASIDERLPGAAQSARYHGTCVAVGEAVRGDVSAAGLQHLEASAADPRFPLLQVLAAFGLAATLERSGEVARAAGVRAFLERTAPHCAPLREPPGRFTRADASAATVEGPVSLAIRSPRGSPPPPTTPARSLLRVVGRTVGLWALLIVLFGVLFLYFDGAR